MVGRLISGISTVCQRWESVKNFGLLKVTARRRRVNFRLLPSVLCPLSSVLGLVVKTLAFIAGLTIYCHFKDRKRGQHIAGSLNCR
jgi:hypothetical protein